jgi:hypothetical protein
MTEREEREKAAAEQARADLRRAPGEEEQSKQFRVNRKWREVSITAALWSNESKPPWGKYRVGNRQGSAAKKGESIEQLVTFSLRVVGQAEAQRVAFEVLRRNRKINPRAWKGKTIESVVPAGWTILVPRPGVPPQVTTLADTGQFTVTGGYAKINVVEIPRRRGISVFAGYDPIAATLPLLLLDMPYGNPSSEQEPIVEKQCSVLEWMAGRGGPGAVNAISQASKNLPPYAVSVSSVAPDGHATRLIPAPYNASFGGLEEWFITGIQWGDSVRDREGKRRKQHLVLTLTENVPLEGANEASKGH